MLGLSPPTEDCRFVRFSVVAFEREFIMRTSSDKAEEFLSAVIIICVLLLIAWSLTGVFR